MADSISNRIFEKLPPKWNSQSIREIYGNIFDWLNLQDTTILIVIVIMILVAISEPGYLPDYFTTGKNPYDWIIEINGVPRHRVFKKYFFITER